MSKKNRSEATVAESVDGNVTVDGGSERKRIAKDYTLQVTLVSGQPGRFTFKGLTDCNTAIDLWKFVKASYESGDLIGDVKIVISDRPLEQKQSSIQDRLSQLYGSK